jgi:SagB-type dehydrogenase family enzyme
LETPEPGAVLIELPAPDTLRVNPVTVSQAINIRRSKRKYSDQSLSLEQLAWLLWATSGVKEKLEVATLRTAPSAGARHPFDIYLAINNVSCLAPGLYRYMALTHQLALIREDKNINTAVTEACLRQKWIAKAAVTFLWVAVPYRAAWRYSERSWRYLFLDAGHVCQNLYLACEAIDACCCAVAAFDDDSLDKLLGLDGDERFVIYAAPAGLK